MTGDQDFKRPLLYVWQPSSLCEKINNSQLKQLDYNIYVRGLGTENNPLIWWSPAQNENCRESFKSLEEMRKLHPEFSANSKYYFNYDGTLFKSYELGNYQLLNSFPGFDGGMHLPSEVGKLINQSGKYIGAYPLVK
jgi:hypothetical protein